ncbi:MAG: (2Fe-2S) ferredoxin domain-containing protein, partial [Pyrinomonadaceae bacterium]
LIVCTHKHCKRRGGKQTLREIKRALRDAGLRKEIMISKIKCLGQCGHGPVVVQYPQGIWYGSVDEKCARNIVENGLHSETPVERKILKIIGVDRSAA